MFGQTLFDRGKQNSDAALHVALIAMTCTATALPGPWGRGTTPSTYWPVCHLATIAAYLLGHVHKYHESKVPLPISVARLNLPVAARSKKHSYLPLFAAPVFQRHAVFEVAALSIISRLIHIGATPSRIVSKGRRLEPFRNYPWHV